MEVCKHHATVPGLEGLRVNIIATRRNQIIAALSEASAPFDWLFLSGDKRLIVLLLIRNGDAVAEGSCSSTRRALAGCDSV